MKPFVPSPPASCVTVLIVNYGTPALTLAAARSACDDPRVGEVILVDNAAPGDSTSLGQLEEFAVRSSGRVRCVAAGRNRGFGGGTNLGAAHATLPYLLFLNSDATLQPGALERLVEALAATGVGLAAPPVYTPAGELQADACGEFPTAWRILLRRTRRPCGGTAPDWVSAVSVLVRRDDFLAAGGFDENIFMYYEDVELCWRFRRLGYRIERLGSGPGVVHQGGASHASTAAQRRAYDRSQDYFLRKSGAPRWSRALVRALRAAYRAAGPVGAAASRPRGRNAAN